MNSRDKGKRGEYQWRDILNKTFNTKYARTPLSGGLDLKGDIMRTHGSPRTIADEFHWEVKRVEKLNIHNAMRQAIRDSRPPLIPCVPFRKNNEDWLICLRSSDFINLLIEIAELRNNKKQDKNSDFEKWCMKKETKRQIRKTVQSKFRKAKDKNKPERKG